MATCAARPIIWTVMCELTSAEMVVWMSPGSLERREPKSMGSCGVVCVGAGKRAGRAS